MRTKYDWLMPDAGRHSERPTGRLSRQKLLVTLSLLAAAAGLVGCSGSSKPDTARASTQTVVPVAVATAERRDVPVYLKGLGSVTARFSPGEGTADE